MGKDQWKQEIEVVLSEYLGDIRDWLEDSNAEQLHYALKEICGQFSKFNGSQDPLSVFGAYLIFLMGAYDRLKSNSLLSDAKDIGWSTFDVDNDDYYLIESDASKKDARSAAKSLFHFGHEICVHEDDIEKSDSMRRQVLGKPELSSSCLSVPLELGEKSKGLVASVEDVPYSDGSTTKHLDQLQESGSFSKKSGRIHFELIVDEGEVHMRFEPQPCRHAMIGTPTYG